MQPLRNDTRHGLGRLGRISIVLYAVGVMAVAGIIAVWRVQQDRTVTLAAARQELATFATGLGTQIEAMLADGVGAAVAGAGAMRQVSGISSRQQMLQEMLTGGDYVRALFVVRDDGATIANREGERYGPADLPAASALAQAGGAVWFGPVREDHAGTLVMPVARRLAQPSGGWAGAFIRISDLDAVYAQLRRLDTSVALVTLDGFALVQLPITGQSYRNLDLTATPIYGKFLQQPVQPLTLLDGPHFETGEPRLHAIYRMRGLHAVATAGRAIRDALEGWRRRSTTLALFLALWTAVVLSLAVGLQALYNRRWTHLRSLAAAQEQVAEARRAEITARQSLTRELLVAQERGRQRLARELHDGIGQSLSLLRNRVVLLKRSGLSEQARTHADALLDLASETLEDLRGVAHNLMPMHLEELGLSSALKGLVERVELSSELIVHARIENVDDVLQGEPAVHVYRIVQEAINNVLRHAGARSLWVEAIRDIDHVELRVRDDGRGPPAAADGGRRGLGLSSIAERCAILGATFSLQPATPSGTSLVISIPLRSTGDQDLGAGLEAARE
jgi:signal transduction histidine kinase